MSAKITRTVTVTGTPLGFTYGDLAALVAAGRDEPTVDDSTPVRLSVDRGYDQRDRGSSSLTLTLDREVS